MPTLDRTKYHAVDVVTLRQLLGNMCSPDKSRKGYVVGPDLAGRFCHCASCFDIYDARRLAKEYNGE